MSANSLLDSGWYPNQLLSDQELAKIREQAGYAKAYDQALNYISLRKRSQKEVRDYLRRKDYEPAVIDRVIDKAVELGLLNDTDFAGSFVRDRQLLKPSSKRQLTAELRQKGASNEAIEAALGEVSEEDEMAALNHMIDRKAHRYSDRQKLIQYLGSKGFRYDMIKRALEEFLE
jgi:regulatory protein